MDCMDRKLEIIPSVRELRYLKKALASDCSVIQPSGAHIGNLKPIVEQCHRQGKKVLINHELVGGLGNGKTAFKMLKQYYQADWIIGSSVSRIHMYQNLGMRSIYKIVLVDSISVENALHAINEIRFDAIELRPYYHALEFLPKFKEYFDGDFYIAGFVNTEERVREAKKAGFKGVMTSTTSLWGLDI